MIREALRHGADVSVHLSGASARAFLSGRLGVDNPRLIITVQADDASVRDASKAVGGLKWTRGSVKDFAMQARRKASPSPPLPSLPLPSPPLPLVHFKFLCLKEC